MSSNCSYLHSFKIGICMSARIINTILYSQAYVLIFNTIGRTGSKNYVGWHVIVTKKSRPKIPARMIQLMKSIPVMLASPVDTNDRPLRLSWLSATTLPIILSACVFVDFSQYHHTTGMKASRKLFDLSGVRYRQHVPKQDRVVIDFSAVTR